MGRETSWTRLTRPQNARVLDFAAESSSRGQRRQGRVWTAISGSRMRKKFRGSLALPLSCGLPERLLGFLDVVDRQFAGLHEASDHRCRVSAKQIQQLINESSL